MELDLAFIWAGIIAFAVLVYVVLDGFDLGIGILFPFLEDEGERDLAMNSIAPVWDGNETWLVMGGGGLFAVFPLAYATVLPALYVPITAMLLALVFRGVAFEYRWRTERWKGVWNLAFFGGSVVAAFTQGVALGALVQGIEIENRAYAGGWWDWLTPYSILTGVGVTIGYTLLGATWLNMKIEGAFQERMRQASVVLAYGTLAAMGAVSIWTPFLDSVYFDRWFAWPSILFSGVMPVLLLYTSYLLFTGLRDKREHVPFIAAVSLFVLGFIGIGISFYPYIVPPSLSIYEAAAPDKSLQFALVGTVVLIPMILGYTIYAYYVFWGKVKPEHGYH